MSNGPKTGGRTFPPYLWRLDEKGIIHMVSSLFLDGVKNAEIVEQVRAATGTKVRPGAIREIVEFAAEQKYLRLDDAPEFNQYADDLRPLVFGGHAGFVPVSALGVVPAVGTQRRVGDQVARRAASLLLNQIYAVSMARLKAGKEPVVHLGFGSGSTSRNVAAHLADDYGRLLANDRSFWSGPTWTYDKRVFKPRLVLHALSNSYSVAQAANTPNTFFQSCFGRFADARDDEKRPMIETVALFAPPAIQSPDEIEDVWRMPVVREAYARRDEIDIVFTSLAWAEDPHGYSLSLASMFGKKVTKAHIQRLRDQGMQGDILYHPYGHDGALTLEDGIRTVTLFDFAELCALAESGDRYVVLAAAPCGHPDCGLTKARALVPLVKDGMRPFTHLAMDITTAKELYPLLVSQNTRGTP